MVEAESEEDALNKVESYDVDSFDESVTVTDSEHIRFEIEEK